MNPFLLNTWRAVIIKSLNNTLFSTFQVSNNLNLPLTYFIPQGKGCETTHYKLNVEIYKKYGLD